MTKKLIIILLSILSNTSVQGIHKQKQGKESEQIPEATSTATVELEVIEGVSKRTRLGYQPRSLKGLSSTSFNKKLIDAFHQNITTKELAQQISDWKQKLINNEIPQDLLNIICNNLIRDTKNADQNLLQLLLNQEPINPHLQLALINAIAEQTPILLTKKIVQITQKNTY